MGKPVDLVELWRGGLLESVHQGHAVICDRSGQIIDAWGDPDMVIFPRSSCKMLQALPLMESGAADAFGLTDEQLALACASHDAANIHTSRVRDWIDTLGFTDADFRCGPQVPGDIPARNASAICAATPASLGSPATFTVSYSQVHRISSSPVPWR